MPTCFCRIAEKQHCRPQEFAIIHMQTHDNLNGIYFWVLKLKCSIHRKHAMYWGNVILFPLSQPLSEERCVGFLLTVVYWP